MQRSLPVNMEPSVTVRTQSICRNILIQVLSILFFWFDKIAKKKKNSTEKMTSDLQKDQEPPASKRPKASSSDDVIIIGTDTDIASQSSPPGAVGGATGGTLAAEGTDQPHPLYRLTTVRGIGARHNRQEAAVGIKGIQYISGWLFERNRAIGRY